MYLEFQLGEIKFKIMRSRPIPLLWRRWNKRYPDSVSIISFQMNGSVFLLTMA